MNHAIRINENLTTTGQVIPKQLEQAIQEGFKSVLNLRSPDELGFFKDEQKVAESLGLHYVNVPLKLEHLDEEIITKILKTLEQLPKPVVMHCAAGMRSTGVALLNVAVEEGLTLEQTIVRARNLGFGFLDDSRISPKIKNLFEQYINKHAKIAVYAA
ncbi:MAG TPA: sulfur transferase domain-containing protein [Nostocaceae cyanobacterium]|nr:sulfur transferase domain-containing protein [Nostocaceae cyanobacterium]